MIRPDRLWVMRIPELDPVANLVLYQLAQDAAISWKGCRMVARKHYRKYLPTVTRICDLVKRLGFCRDTIRHALTTLWNGDWLVRDREHEDRLEPNMRKLYLVFHQASKQDKMAIPRAVAEDPKLNATDKMVAGKLSKLDTQWWRRGWRIRPGKLARDLGRHVRTISRSLSRLLGLGCMTKVVRRTARVRTYNSRTVIPRYPVMESPEGVRGPPPESDGIDPQKTYSVTELLKELGGRHRYTQKADWHGWWGGETVGTSYGQGSKDIDVEEIVETRTFDANKLPERTDGNDHIPSSPGLTLGDCAY